MGKEDYVKAHIEAASEANFSAVKFQLFPNHETYTSTGNIWLSPVLFEKAMKWAEEYGVDCSASVFGEAEFQFLKQFNPKFIKLAYSKKQNRSWIEECLDASIEPIVSCDVMSDHLIPMKATRLFCIPQYPVYFEISFDEIFPRFDGFSDHSLSFRQTRNAVEAGARIIEKHVALKRKDINCPDARFAASFADAANFHADLVRLEKEVYS